MLLLLPTRGAMIKRGIDTTATATWRGATTVCPRYHHTQRHSGHTHVTAIITTTPTAAAATATTTLLLLLRLLLGNV